MPTRQIPPQRLLFLTGKGGTGRTMVAAAMGLHLAGAGERTLLLELDENATVGTLFGIPELGVEPARLADNLYAARLQGLPALRLFLQRFVPSRRVADLLLRNRVAMTLFESAPGVFDTVMLDRVAALAGDSSWDRILVDLPATGHARTLLQLPAAMADAFGGGQLSQHVRRLGDLIVDPVASSLVVVTLPEEMPVTETIEFCRDVRSRVDIAISLVVANAVRRVPMAEAELLALDHAVRDAALAAPARASRLRLGLSLARYWGREDAAGLVRLGESFGEERLVELPFVFEKKDDRHLISVIAQKFESLFAPGGAG